MKPSLREPFIRASLVLLALAAAILIVRRTSNAPGRDQASHLEHRALVAAPAPTHDLDGPPLQGGPHARPLGGAPLGGPYDDEPVKR